MWLVIPSGDAGLPGSLCGILGVHVDDQTNGERGARWVNAMKRLQARLPVMDHWQGRVHRLLVGTAVLFFRSTVQEGMRVKPAKRRRNAKTSRLCHSLRNPQSPVYDTTRQLVGGADTARSDLPDQPSTAMHAKGPRWGRFGEPMHGFVELISSRI